MTPWYPVPRSCTVDDMSSEERNRRSLGFTLGQALDEVPGVSLVRKVAHNAVKETQRQIAEKFLETVRPYVNQNNFEAVNLYVSQQLETPGLVTLLEEELKDLHAVGNETARQCLALLAVDRNLSSDIPDELYRQLAVLLVETSKSTLKIIQEMADAVCALEHQFIALMAGDTEDGAVCYMIAPGKEAVFLSSSISPSGFTQTIELLARHRMANGWIGWGSVYNKAPGIMDVNLRHLGRIDDYHLTVWATLRKYLVPIRND